ncbi:MAG: DUF465 domain-containing protein [Nitrospirae bacterium]|nr:DUF465 domain-containing protein [Nitrospirota bacterium]
MKEQEIMAKLSQENEEFRKVSDEHHDLDMQLIEVDKKVYLTPEEDLDRKKLAKRKLHLKDKMAEMVRDYKKAHPDS